MKPISNICASLYEVRDHAMIGVSPFNSYFSEARLTDLFSWAKQHFNSFHVFVPDEATRYTLEAAGYSQARAKKKARRQANYLLNKIKRALLKTSPKLDLSFVLTNGVLRNNGRYNALLAKVEQRFATDRVFRQQCLECTRWVLENQVEEIDTIDEAALLHAVQYFLEEMPLFMDSASIVSAHTSVFCYHQCPAVLQGLYEDRSDGLIDEQQGFLIVKKPMLATKVT